MDICPFAQEEIDHLNLPVPYRGHKRSLTVVEFHIDIGTLLKQELDNRRMAIDGCCVQRGYPPGGFFLDTGTVLGKVPDNIEVADPCRVGEDRYPFVVPDP